MENLLSSALSHATLPDSFIFPPDQRPPASFRVVSLTQSRTTHAMDRETSTAAAGSTRRLLRLAAFLFLCSIAPVRAAKKQSSYIVYLGGGGVSMEEASMVATESHYDLLGSVLGDREKARDAIFYSYTKNINGFAAVLDPDVAAEIAGHPGVVSVFPNSGRKMHTTRSWEYGQRGERPPVWPSAEPSPLSPLSNTIHGRGTAEERILQIWRPRTKPRNAGPKPTYLGACFPGDPASRCRRLFTRGRDAADSPSSPATPPQHPSTGAAKIPPPPSPAVARTHPATTSGGGEGRGRREGWRRGEP